MNEMPNLPSPQDAKFYGEAIEHVGKGANEFSKAISQIWPGLGIKSRIKAERFATDALIADFEKISESQGLTEPQKSVLTIDALVRYGRLENFESVLQLAGPLINEKNKAKDVDPEWAEEFYDQASKAHHESTRRLWARILAGEINQPGTYSKRTLNILGNMQQSDAELFQKVCSYSIGGIDGERNYTSPLPILIRGKKDRSLFNDGELSVKEIHDLADLGLLNTEVHAIFPVKVEGSPIIIHGSQYTINNNTGKEATLNVSGALFTNAGAELSMLCELGNALDFQEFLSTKWFVEGLAFSISDVLNPPVPQYKNTIIDNTDELTPMTSQEISAIIDKTEVFESPENLYRQELLDTLSAMPNPKQRHDYVTKIFEESPEGAEKFGDALDDLVRYGCIDGISIFKTAGDGYNHFFGGNGIEIIKDRYPSIEERAAADAEIRNREMINEQMGAYLDKLGRLGRM